MKIKAIKRKKISRLEGCSLKASAHSIPFIIFQFKRFLGLEV